MTRSAAILLVTLLLVAVGPSLEVFASLDPETKVSDSVISASVEGNGVDPGSKRGGATGGTSQPIDSPSTRALPASIAPPAKVKGAKKRDKVEVKTEGCTNMALPQCANARAGCITAAGNPNYFQPPTITWVRVNDGPWQYSGLHCGTPTSVTVPASGGQAAATVRVEAPPVPTFAQIQQAYRELPFSKPSASIQPVGLKTLVGLPTYFAAEWPDDSNLQPDEVSEPVTLLSWTVEFKVAAQDYRYNYGDGQNSGWTSSTGGSHPDGDITHTYKETGDVDVSVDARLTGEYRVNGGSWQDIATTADLQDEPIETLQVLGTDTSLVHD